MYREDLLFMVRLMDGCHEALNKLGCRSFGEGCFATGWSYKPMCLQLHDFGMAESAVLTAVEDWWLLGSILVATPISSAAITNQVIAVEISYQTLSLMTQLLSYETYCTIAH